MVNELRTFRDEVIVCSDCSVDDLDLCEHHDSQIPGEKHERTHEIISAICCTDRHISTVSDLANDLNVTPRTISNHIDRVVSDPLVDSREAGKTTVYWPGSSCSKFDSPDDEIPNKPTPQRIRHTLLVTDEPVLSATEISERLNVSDATVREHIDEATDHRDIHKKKVGRVTVYYYQKHGDPKNSEFNTSIPTEVFERADEHDKTVGEYLRDLTSLERSLIDAGLG